MTHTVHILALHGFTGCGADFDPFANKCVGTWHHPDLPGHSTGKALQCSQQSTTRWIQNNLEGLPKKPKILVGYSMGARAALNHAVNFPTAWDGLILISPNPGIEDEADREARRLSDEGLAKRIESDGLIPFFEYWQSTPLIQSQQSIQAEWLDAMQINRRHHSAKGLAQSLREFGQGNCPNLWPMLQQIRVPILCMTGESDTKYHSISERIAQILPNAEHVTIPNAGHMPHLENPETSAFAVNQFLSQFTDQKLV
ncbi:MAG: alpha/beta fold hydrolase [Lentimonas sp.]